MAKRKHRDQDGIFERPDSPYWWASFTDGGGRAARKSTGIRREADPYKEHAKAVRAEWVAQAAKDRRQQSLPKGQTFDDLMLLYLEGQAKAKRSHERDLHSAKHLYAVFTGRELVSLTRSDARAYRSARLTAAQPGTINRELGLISAALNWARRELEWQIPNPFAGMRLAEPKGRSRWLTREEAAALLSAAELRLRAPYLRDYILLGLNTGMRPGELLGLEWARIDLSANLIYFEAEHQKNGKVGSVPLNSIARKALLARARFRARYCPDTPWVFCTRRGERIQSVKKSFAAACRKAGLTDVRPHDLRRTCGSWLVQEGVPIQHVARLLRHSDIRVTDRVYAHLSPESIRLAVRALEGDVSRVKPKRMGFGEIADATD